jgi:methionyl aminopeptidase
MLSKNNLKKYKKAAQIQIKTRKWLQQYLKPNMNIYNVCLEIENKLKKEVKYDPNNPLKQSIPYPVGISVNNCAAHWTPPKNDKATFQYDDVIKFDFGVQIDGFIIDAAYTHTFNPKYDSLLAIAQEATNTGIKSSGPDAILGEIGSDIQEVIENSEIELDGKTYQLKSIRDLCGHKIDKYKIHGGKAVPNIAINYPVRMEIGEIYAIETFPSTGTGGLAGHADPSRFSNGADCSHYMIDYTKNYMNLLNGSRLTGRDKKFFHTIHDKYSTLAFDKKWLYDLNMNYSHCVIGLSKLVTAGIVNTYVPLYDVSGSVVAQFEHDIYIKDNGVEILTKSDDY